MREIAGNAAALAARCKNRRRGRFIMPSLFQLDVGRVDYLGAKSAGKLAIASPEITEPSHHLRIGKTGLDLPVEFIDDRLGLPASPAAAPAPQVATPPHFRSPR